MKPRPGLAGAAEVDRLAKLYPATSPTTAARRLPSVQLLTPAEVEAWDRLGMECRPLRLHLVATGTCWRLVWARDRDEARRIVVALAAGAFRPVVRLARRGDLAKIIEARKLLVRAG